MATVTLDRFWDEEAGTFWFTPGTGEKLFAAKQSTDDSVLPSANASAGVLPVALGWAATFPAWQAWRKD